ncbi:MAG: hypothetical protein D6772_06570 [Bacteroidetes bacterium]|nr:MAG: hypothetical protein D6772_06570 [Bacteroidota bacterium]
MNALLQLFKTAGILAAGLLCVGLLNRSDLQLFERQEITDQKSVMSATAEVSDVFGTMSRDEAPLRRQASSARPQAEETAPRQPRRATTIASVNRSSRPGHSTDLEAWLELNVAQTFLEAEKETIAPGVILATGLYFLQEGQGDMSMKAADVAAYLAEVRDHAARDAKKHMKYIANSEAWFTGLKKAGFEGEQIARLFRRFRLDQYDRAMYDRFVRKKVEENEYDRPSTTLSDEVEERNRSLAQAYNDYADRPETRKKLGLPSIRKPRAMAVAELSKGRQEALSFAPGESRTYDEPRFFWAVLKEMIALEADYDSWEDYHRAQPEAADRAFRERSNIMALGGVMKITRKEGA